MRLRTAIILAALLAVSALVAQLPQPGGAGGGGGGGTTWNAPVAFASIPACSTTVFFQPLNDSVYDYALCDGATALSYFRNGMRMYPPSSVSFSWDNQDVASVTTTNGAATMTAAANVNDEIFVQYTTAPSTPWTLSVAMLFLNNQNNNHAGLAVGEAATGEWETLSIADAGHRIYRWTTATAFSIAPRQKASLQSSELYWLRVSDNGTNRSWHFSNDGLTWRQYYSTTSADFLTADRIGWYVNSRDSEVPSSATIVTWRLE